MWMLLDRKVRYTLLVLFALVITVIYWGVALRSEVPMTLMGLGRQGLASLFSAIGTATLIITLVGKRAFLWRYSLHVPFVKTLLKFPDVNGVWLGFRASAFELSEAAMRGDPAPPTCDHVAENPTVLA